MKRSIAAVVGLTVVALAIQLVPVERTNPPIEEEVPAPPAVRELLRRACYDCHSRETTWPWYAHVAPVSWLVAHDVEEARDELDLSAWNRLDPKKRRKKLEEIWEEVEEGEMPLWYYVLLHPEAKLSAGDRETLRAWTEAARAH